MVAGEQAWTLDTGGSVWAQPAVGNDLVYVGSVGVADYMVAHAGWFRAVGRDGVVRWRFPVPDPGTGKRWGVASAPATDGDRVFVGDLDGVVRAFRAEP